MQWNITYHVWLMKHSKKNAESKIIPTVLISVLYSPFQLRTGEYKVARPDMAVSTAPECCTGIYPKRHLHYYPKLLKCPKKLFVVILGCYDNFSILSNDTSGDQVITDQTHETLTIGYPAS